jgi:hypothetical protein
VHPSLQAIFECAQATATSIDLTLEHNLQEVAVWRYSTVLLIRQCPVQAACSSTRRTTVAMPHCRCYVL